MNKYSRLKNTVIHNQKIAELIGGKKILCRAKVDFGVKENNSTKWLNKGELFTAEYNAKLQNTIIFRTASNIYLLDLNKAEIL